MRLKQLFSVLTFFLLFLTLFSFTSQVRAADLLEVFYKQPAPAGTDKQVFDALIKDRNTQWGNYYYKIYSAAKEDVLVNKTAAIPASWQPEKVLLNGKEISYSEYAKLFQAGELAKYRVVYYQNTPAGLLELGELKNGVKFKPLVKLLEKPISAMPPGAWYTSPYAIGGGVAVIAAALGGGGGGGGGSSGGPPPFTPNPPSSPLALNANAISQNEVELFWIDASDIEEGYEIERRTDSTSYSKINSMGPGNGWIYYLDSTAQPNTNYFYRVRAYNAGGFSAYSNEANTFTAAGNKLADSDWPMFHHDLAHSGLSPSTGPGTMFPVIKWSYPAAGFEAIEASPAIGPDNSIYAGTLSGYFYARQPDGGQKWERSFPATRFFSSPAIARDKTIYVGGYDAPVPNYGTLYALRGNDGGNKWSFSADPNPLGRIESSPAIGNDGTVYFGTITGTTGYLYAVDSNGNLKWFFNAGNPINSSPAIGPDGAIYFATTAGQVYALIDNGTFGANKAGWGAPVNLGANVNYSSPVIHSNGNVLYICSDTGGVSRIYALKTVNGAPEWGAPYSTASGIQATPALSPSGGVLYVGDINGRIYAVNAVNGGEHWPQPAPPWSAGFYSSPLVDSSGYIYVGATDGSLYGFQDNGQGNFPSSLWAPVILGGPVTHSSCALAGNGALYIGAGDGKLYKISSSFTIDPAQIQISKKANKQQVAIGEVVTYKITITNNGIDPTDPGQTTTIIDKIPPGFKYVKGSSRLTSPIVQQSVVLTDPIGDTTLTFDVGDFAVGETKVLTYQLVVGSGVTFGKYENKAYARYFYNKPPLTEETSPIVKETVLVVPDPLFDLGTIIGKVFNDRNNNGVQDEAEEGIEGAQIITEDGAIVTTDKDGKYHIPGVAPGIHLLKLNRPTVKQSNSAQVVRVTEGLLCKVNFPVTTNNELRITNDSTTDNRSPITGSSSFTLVALADGELGYSRVSEDRNADLRQHVKNDDRFEDGWYDKSKFAGYLKADIQDKYRITSSLDTTRTRRRELFRYIDPDKYYPNYGDQSSIDWDATNTQGPLYLFVETTPKSGLGDSSFLWGNYATNLTGNELANYNRTLYGAKLQYQTDQQNNSPTVQSCQGGTGLKTTLFAAEAFQIAAHNEFRATGGSFYYLKHKNIVEGSEQIKIEVRDKITHLPLSTNYEERLTNYEIDYSNGRIIFKQPVQSVQQSNSIISSNILDGNPVYIIVDYEYRPDRFHFNQGTYGGRASYTPFNHTAIGATYVQEQVDAEDYQLTGLDTAIDLPLATKLKVAYAETTSRGISGFVSLNGGFTFDEISLTPDDEGSAYRISTQSKPISSLNFNTYYQRLQAGFSTTGSVTQQGTEKYGIFASQQIIPERLTLNLRHDTQETLRNSNLVPSALVGGEQTEATTLQSIYQKDRLTLTGEYRYQKVNSPLIKGAMGVVTSETNRDTALGALKINYKLSEKMSAFVEQQATLKGESNYQTTAGLSAQLQKNLSANLQGTTGTKGNSALLGLTSQISDQTQAYTNISYASLRSSDPLTSNLQPETFSSSTIPSSERTTGIASGVTSQITPGTRIYAQEEYRTSSSAVSNASAIGQDSQLSEQWQIGCSFERGLINNFDGTDTVRKSSSLRIGYHDLNKFNATTKLEARFDEGDDDRTQYLTANYLKYQLTPDLSLLGRLNWSRTENDLTDQTDALFKESGIGVAFRPVKWDKLNLLGKYTYLIDYRPANQTDFSSLAKQRATVYALEAAYDINKHFQMVEKYAFKNGQEKITGQNYTDSDTDLWIHRLNYQLLKCWTTGLEYRVLRQKLADDQKQGFLGEVIYKINESIQLGGGYNFTDFDDDLITDNDYSAHGPFIRVLATFTK